MNADDYLNPKWDEAGKVHDWRNYINETLRFMWSTFTDQQKKMIALNADELADREDWD